MTDYQHHVKALLDAAEAPTLTPQARGKKFEELLIHLFASVADTLVANRGGFRSLPPEFLVECKNYSAPLDSKSVGYFLFICISRRANLAVIVASSGLTGGPEQNHALSLAKAASALGTRLVVLTRLDIISLTCAGDLVDLLESRYLKAFASGGVGAA